MNTLEITVQRLSDGTNAATPGAQEWRVVLETRRADDLVRIHDEAKLCFCLSDLQQALRSQVRINDYGVVLGAHLFQGSVDAEFRQARREAGAGGLRVLLTIEDDALRALHWE